MQAGNLVRLNFSTAFQHIKTFQERQKHCKQRQDFSDQARGIIFNAIPVTKVTKETLFNVVGMKSVVNLFQRLSAILNFDARRVWQLNKMAGLKRETTSQRRPQQKRRSSIKSIDATLTHDGTKLKCYILGY